MQTSSLEAVQAWRRWPGPHVGNEQAVQVEAVSAALFALYVLAAHGVQVGFAALVLL